MPSYRENAEHAWTSDSVRLILTPSSFAKASLYHVQEVGRFYALPAYYTERERLDSFLIVYTISGRGKLVYQGRTYLLCPGDVFFIDCMEHQHYATDTMGQWEIAWAHVNGPAIRAYYELFASGAGPVRSLAEDNPIPARLRELLELHRVRSLQSELLASKILTELLTELLLHSADSELPLSPLPESVSGVMRFIDKHYAEKLPLDRLANHFTIDKYRLARSFKKHTGFSPGEYIINARISKAKELLKYADLSVAEIAEHVGIENVSHFIRLFRDRVGQTPLAFRQAWKDPK